MHSAISLASRFVSNTFDLAAPPLIRGLLIRSSECEHLLALSMHHIVSDGASIDVFFQELSTIYQALKSGSALHLPELSIQYADYAIWQREWLKGDVLHNQVKYWKQALGGAEDAILFPIDRPRPVTQTFNGATFDFPISPDIEQSARRLSLSHGATVFMAFLAGFHSLLHKYSGQDDISIGIPVANRGLSETEPLIGFFVNTVVIRGLIDPTADFHALLRQIRQRAIEAYTHQDIPFEKLVEELHPRRDLSRHPLFQVALAIASQPRIPETLGDVLIAPVSVESKTSKFDLFLSIEDTAGAMAGVIEYNTDLFDRPTVQRIAHHFSVLTERLFANPDLPLCEASMISECDVAQLVYEWNDTASETYEGETFPEVFERTVESLPDSVALTYRDSFTTYSSLNERANRLARFITDCGL
ncbi:MAG: condensation domain-containing protein, partial [Blastocatellia bacterium]